MNQLSWSQKLFLRINHTIGRIPLLDRAMLFCAHQLIYAMLVIIVWWVLRLVIVDGGLEFTAAVFPIGSMFLSYAVSYTIALLWPHARPFNELRRVRHLFVPFGLWKSFPSDHTIMATLIVGILVVTGAPMQLVVPMGVSGLLVAAGRVYAGVHYPRDILGGIMIGLAGLLLSYDIVY